MKNVPRSLMFAGCLAVAMAVPSTLQAQKNRQAGRNAGVAPGGLVAPLAGFNPSEAHQDFPSVSIAPNGFPLAAYVEYNGVNDVLKFAKLNRGKLVERLELSERGDLLQPGQAVDANQLTWVVWPQMRDGRWDLFARSIDHGRLDASPTPLTENAGNNVFVDVQADPNGRVWVAWQRFDGGFSDIFARYYDPEKGAWSPEIQVTSHKAGDWEPRLAFAGKETFVLFDSYRSGDYDLLLARINPDNRKVDILPIARSQRYEARGSVAPSTDGKALWIAYEEGVERWGKDLGSEWRKIGGGLNYDRRVKFVRFDVAKGEVEPISDVTPLIPGVLGTRGDVTTGAINLPEVIVDAAGRPWVFFRYCLERGTGFWQIAYAGYDPSTGKWTEARTLEQSSYCQDRRCGLTRDADGQIHAFWPSDNRRNKQQGDTMILSARIDPGEQGAFATELPFRIEGLPETRNQPFNQTPERPRHEHHEWKLGDRTYSLYWGDLHRHTDFSVCRTSDDGCIVEHFRYALDAGGLDYLATSDHTDNGKVLSPYEWWQNQKLADIFQIPGFFLSFYAYEREQKWPYGHRNVVFLERGGPIVYIKRRNYVNSPWSTPLPPQEGVREGELAPWQLWKLLRVHGQRTLTIEHTPAGGMGTDWSVYDRIDTKFENVLEMYQGSREASEGVGAPQPRIATDGKSQWGKFNAGTWQNALRLGHKLGAFASSDHRSLHISFGGVYVDQFNRQGIFDGIDARRTVAATDKIFMEFSCNGRPLGSEFEIAEKPRLDLAVDGTAAIRRVTVVRNEKDYKVFEPGSAHFATEFTDPEPLEGENRYYLRIEQVDGNMGWTSPIWVTFRVR